MGMPSTTLLDRELYDVSAAASVLRIPESTLRWWLEGGERRGKVYEPVLRRQATGSSVVTWGELIEAGYLAVYRKGLRVKLWRLRDFIAYLRDELDVPYPLATARPWVGPGRRLLVEAADQAGLDQELRPLIEPATGQGVLTGIAERFLARVEFDPPGVPSGEAVRIHPAGRESPVVIDPEVRFGTATVHGISTAVLAEKAAAGEPVDALAAGYDLDVRAVVAALAYEDTDWPLLLTAA